MTDIIKQSKQAHATVLLVGIKLPPNYGEPYTTQFQNIYTHLAEKYRVNLLPFLLEGVAPDQFLPDNLHPSAEAQPLIMRNVMQAIKLLPNQRSEIPFGVE